MLQNVILQIISTLGPLVMNAVNDYHARHGRLPTSDELIAHITANADMFLAEGAAWKATHPKV